MERTELAAGEILNGIILSIWLVQPADNVFSRSVAQLAGRSVSKMLKAAAIAGGALASWPPPRQPPPHSHGTRS